MLPNKTVGALGESLSINFLRNRHFTIVDRHVTSRWGEIDIVASKDSTLHFIEVKTRTSLIKGFPYEAVGYRKLKNLHRSIEYYLLKNKVKHTKLSLDVISIVLSRDLNVVRIDFYENVERG